MSLSPDYVVKREAERLLGCGQTKLWMLIKSGVLVAKRDGNKVLVGTASIRAHQAALPDAKDNPGPRPDISQIGTAALKRHRAKAGA